MIYNFVRMAVLGVFALVGVGVIASRSGLDQGVKSREAIDEVLSALDHTRFEELPSFIGTIDLSLPGAVDRMHDWFRSGTSKEKLVASIVLAPQEPAYRTYAFESLLDGAPGELGALYEIVRLAHKDLPNRLRNTTLAIDTPSRQHDIRRANSACTLLLLNADEQRAWDLLKFTQDPQARSFMIQRLSQAKVNREVLLKRLDKESDLGIRCGIVLALGEYTGGASSLGRVRERVLELYENDPEPAMHGAAKWFLKRQAFDEEIEEADQRLAKAPVKPGQGWRVTPLGLTFVAVRDEQNDRWFEISDSEVSVRQFLRFRPGQSYQEEECPDVDGPINRMNASTAAEFCNWLSSQDRINPAQFAFRSSADSATAVPVDSIEQSHGYRLPTASEFELACRAGTTTRRSFGSCDELVPAYAWCGQPYRVAFQRSYALKPNALGLFDMMGNVEELCLAPGEASTPWSSELRGGSILLEPESLRSDLARGPISVSETGSGVQTAGFRVVRTLPRKP